MRLKEFFYLPKSDRSVLVLLLFVAAIAIFIVFETGKQTASTGLSAHDSLPHKPHSTAHYTPAKAQSQYIGDLPMPKKARFAFDPNTADSTDLLLLGLSTWQVRAIYKYRSKGGVFRTPSDFARLYGLTVKQFKELQPYIRISEDYRPAADLYPKTTQKGATLRDTIAYPVKLKASERIALNAADTTMLRKVPGIGSYFARQIVNYRNRLGGFYSVEQLAEIEDFPLESITYFTVNPEAIHRLNVNKLTLNQLKRHPYINFYQAREICDFRRLRGPLKSLDDLRLLKDFTPEVMQRLAPYISF